MGSSDIGATLDRIWLLLEMLPQDGRGLTAEELLRLGETEFKWDIGKKTVERYLGKLEEAELALKSGPVNYEEHPEPRATRWRAHPTHNLSTARLRTEDALALHLIARVADKLLPPQIVDVLSNRLEQAQIHLNHRRKASPMAAWANKVEVIPEGFSLQAPSIDRTILQTLQRALLSGSQVEATYRAKRGTSVRTYPLEPRALIQKGAVLYFVATRPDHRDRPAASYCVHRFVAVKPLKLGVSGGFNLQDFIAAGGAEFGAKGEPIRFKAWVSADLEKTLRETPLSTDMALKSCDDGAVVSATLRQSWPFESWLLSRGRHIRVIEPEVLRDETAARLKAAAAAYD